jgi:hypothetical protein
MSWSSAWMGCAASPGSIAIDDSDDTSAAVRTVLLAVYTSGVKRGAVEGYNVGYKDGKRGKPKAGDADTARRVVGDIGSDDSRKPRSSLEAAE